MLTTLLVIAGVVILLSGIAYWVYDNFDYVYNLSQWAQNIVDVISKTFPDWLLPFVAVALALAVISIIVKLL